MLYVVWFYGVDVLKNLNESKMKIGIRELKIGKVKCFLFLLFIGRNDNNNIVKEWLRILCCIFIWN